MFTVTSLIQRNNILNLAVNAVTIVYGKVTIESKKIQKLFSGFYCSLHCFQNFVEPMWMKHLVHVWFGLRQHSKIKWDIATTTQRVNRQRLFLVSADDYKSFRYKLLSLYRFATDVRSVHDVRRNERLHDTVWYTQKHTPKAVLKQLTLKLKV